MTTQTIAHTTPATERKNLWSLIIKGTLFILDTTHDKSSLVYSIGWALFRCYVGISIALGAGFSKMPVPGWFVNQVAEIGFTYPSPAFWSYLAVYGEAFGGVLVALGLFTRFSAIQLAFQFFVVSFIWYSEPMFMFSMYYQQLIFFTFLIVSVLGGGRISIDHLLVAQLKKWLKH